MLFLREPLLKQFRNLWPQSCRTLVTNLKNFSKGVTKYKRRIATEAPDDLREEIMKKMMEKINEHYDGVLRFFDKAIQELDKEAIAASPQVQIPVSWSPGSFFGAPSSPNPCVDAPSETTRNRGASSRLITLQLPRKRASEEDPDDQPEAKRAGHDDPDDDPKTPPRPRAKARTSAIQGLVAVSSPLRPKDSYGQKEL